MRGATYRRTRKRGGTAVRDAIRRDLREQEFQRSAARVCGYSTNANDKKKGNGNGDGNRQGKRGEG